MNKNNEADEVERKRRINKKKISPYKFYGKP